VLGYDAANRERVEDLSDGLRVVGLKKLDDGV
jgi:hypothetical protein